MKTIVGKNYSTKLKVAAISFKDIECWVYLSWLVVMAMAAFVIMMCGSVAGADDFTDLFYTNSFRGSFNWLTKMDWLGWLVQACLSIFSVLGVGLITIRIVSSMLVISARPLMQEIHDLKSQGESNLYDFGMVNMVQSWAKGKAGTGADAIIGAVLMLAPDFMKYSDFNEKSGLNLDTNITMTSYFLKIALPTVMAVFFFAMAFNGTMWKFIAVTVDMLGSVADKAVSVNYTAIANSIIGSGTGYNSVFAEDGTNEGALKQKIFKDVYGHAIGLTENLNAAQLEKLGMNVEEFVSKINSDDADGDKWKRVTQACKDGLNSEDGGADRYWSYLGYDVGVSPNSELVDSVSDYKTSLSELMSGVNGTNADSISGEKDRYIYVTLKSTNNNYTSVYNIDTINKG